MASQGRTWAVAALVSTAVVAAALAQAPVFNAHDDFTEYALLDPATHQFRIVYYLIERQIGATSVVNQIRPGSGGSDIAVRDPRSGEPLRFEYKTGAELMTERGAVNLAPAEHYIHAFLARPVPEDGEGRVRIEKTYLDERAYSSHGDDLVFARSLGIGRNAVVLPAGYALASANVSGQVATRPDGRVGISFENVNGFPADVMIRGTRRGATAGTALPIVDRAFDFTKTLYDLGDPSTHRITVRHEFVTTQPGSRAALTVLDRDPLGELAVIDLDTGNTLKVVAEGGKTSAVLEAPIASDAQSAHLRVTGLEIDSRYRADGGVLAWEKDLDAPRTVILLPAGWDLATVSTPATISTQADGRVAVVVINPRVEPAAMVLRATKRPTEREP